jgi:AraC-like DNA-binding protein
MPSSRSQRDVDLLGKNTVQWSLDCPLLREHRILSLGHSIARGGYRVLRQNPSFSNINLTLAGRGEAFIGGRWKSLTEGSVTLAPRAALHGARCRSGERWEFCWICFSEPPGSPPRLAVDAPTLTQTDPRPLAWAILSFYREFRDARQKAILDALLRLIDLYLQRITEPWPMENHLWKLWEKVALYPERPWTEATLAREVHLSSRHLLRLCRKECGRTLREQITHLRLTRAAAMLQNEDMKLQAIAEAVGYRDAFTFSKAFKRWSGISPSDYRL